MTAPFYSSASIAVLEATGMEIEFVKPGVYKITPCMSTWGVTNLVFAWHQCGDNPGSIRLRHKATK
jgi:hypothetical protein